MGNVDVLGPAMELRVFSQSNSSLIVAIDHHRLGRFFPYDLPKESVEPDRLFSCLCFVYVFGLAGR